MNISFGKKVPLMQCSIKETENYSTIPATVYEYDCQSSNDIEDVLYMGKDWYYYLCIARDMQDKYELENFEEGKSPSHFYVMENQNGKTVALCETKETDDSISVEYIETKHDSEQKYCGKTMLAALGKKLIDNNGNKLKILNPLREVRGFYRFACGFQPVPKTIMELEMNPEQVKEFIEKTELQSGGKILNIKA